MPHDFYTSLELCNANQTTVTWNSNFVCNVTCCHGESGPYSGCGCGLFSIFVYLHLCHSVGSCSLGNKTGTLWQLSEAGGVLNYCFDGDTPLYIDQLSPAEPGVFRVEFLSYVPGPPSESFFVLPSFCACTE